MKSERKKPYQHEAFYKPLRAAIETTYFGQSSVLTVEQIQSVARANDIELPPDIDLSAMKDNFQRLMREALAALKPIALTDEEAAQLTVRSYLPALRAAWPKKDKNDRLAQALSAGETYLRIMKEIGEGNALNRVESFLELRISFLADEYVEKFAQFRRSNPDEMDASYVSKLRSLAEFIHGRTTNAGRSRASRHFTGSPEIESDLRAYQAAATGKKEKNIRKANACAARELIKASGVKSRKVLLSEAGQKQLTNAERLGKIGSLKVSKARSALRWIYHEHGVEIISYLTNQKAEVIFDLKSVPEIDRRLRIACVALRKSKHKYAFDSTKNMLVLCRHLSRVSQARTVEEFYSIEPSTFIKALLDAESKGNTLQPFQKIKMFVLAFTRVLPKELHWPEIGSQSFAEFSKAISLHTSFGKSTVGKTIKVHDFEHAFTSKGVQWSVFFEALKSFYYDGASYDQFKEDEPLTLEELEAEADIVEPKKRQIMMTDDFEESEDDGELEMEEDEELRDYTADDLPRVGDYLLDLAFGKKRGNRLKNGIKGPDGETREGGIATKTHYDKKSLRVLESATALAVQFGAFLRFNSEAEILQYWTRVPELKPSSVQPHRLFFWPEKNCFAIHMSRRRKNKVSGLASFNAISDKVIQKYISVKKLKHGDAFFDASIPWLADEIRRHLTIIFADKMIPEKFVNGDRDRGIPSHQMRHIGRRHLEGKYSGMNKELGATCVLLHKVSRDTKDRSTVADTYGDSFFYSLEVFDLVRAIKNGDYRQPSDVKVDEAHRASEQKNQKEHQQTRRMVIEAVKNAVPMTAEGLFAQMELLPPEERSRLTELLKKLGGIQS